MGKVGIIADSTCDLPGSLIKELGVRIVPLTVHFGDEQFRDHYDLTSQGFIDKLVTSKHHPRTSQPSPNDFAEVYRELSGQYESLVVLTISSKLSGTYQSAVMALELAGNPDVEIVDTRSASLGVGAVVVAAARAAAAGKNKQEVVAAARRVADNLRVFFVVDTLEYLERNGRIGKAQFLLGTLLKIKPILTLEDGVVASLEKVRGKAKVIPRLVELAGETAGGREVDLAVVHAAAPEEARQLRQALSGSLKVRELLAGQLGPVIATHAGPGTLGLFVVTV
ncbi:MAG: DegV family protein [bacterium]|nr:DegV family protein [bacterium]